MVSSGAWSSGISFAEQQTVESVPWSVEIPADGPVTILEPLGLCEVSALNNELRHGRQALAADAVAGGRRLPLAEGGPDRFSDGDPAPGPDGSDDTQSAPGPHPA